jgi:mono/diheme cytochrome c family protein
MQSLGGKAGRITILSTLCLGVAAGSAACSSSGGEPTASTSQAVGPSAQQIAHGQEIWLKATFGGQIFFSLVLPQAPLSLPIGIGNVLLTPRSERFTQWGVVNDPGCTDGNASTGGLDICANDTDPNDPEEPLFGEPSGVVGIRKFPNPIFNPQQPPSTTNSPFIFGVSCAGCHAGLNPQNPPADPNHPTWDNIHLTTGNQYINTGAIFGANLPPSDPRYQVFHTWAPGTVDTTAIESDGINNPGIITQFYDFPDRPYFTVHQGGVLLNNFGVTNGQAHRAGQGGEDDVGCQLAATRVYFNIGMCAQECMLPHLGTNPPATQTPIDMNACLASCQFFGAEQSEVADECAFINDAASTPAPSLGAAPGGQAYIDHSVVQRGSGVFEKNCAGCHSNGQPAPHNVWSNDQMHFASGYNPLIGEPSGDVGTNECRSLTTNWMAGSIWAEFSSDEKKAEGPSWYRDVPLLGVWATAPFFHNNRLGTYNQDPSISGRVAAFEDAYNQLVNPWLRNELGSIQVTTAPITVDGITLPAGTPVALFANLDPTTLRLRCSDLVENGGHYFGALLGAGDKYALREFLKTL